MLVYLKIRLGLAYETRTWSSSFVYYIIHNFSDPHFYFDCVLYTMRLTVDIILGNT